jgi:hypothetical protein
MKLKFWIGIAISVICLYLVFKGIEGRKLWEVLKSANYAYLALATLINFSSFWMRAERWKYLLEPIKKISSMRLFPVTVIGFMATNILPARAGEFVKAYLVGKKENISATASFATIVLERVLDSLIILALFVLVLFQIDFKDQPHGMPHTSINLSGISPAVLKTTGTLFALGLGAVFIFLLLLKMYPTTAIAITNKILFPLPKRIREQAAEMLESFSSGLKVLGKGSSLLPLLFWSLCVWVTSAGSIWVTLLAFDLHLPFFASAFILVLIAFAVALPSSPGFIGPFHAATSAGLIFFSIDKSTATGISLILHLILIGPVTLAGLFYLWIENLSFSEIKPTSS